MRNLDPIEELANENGDNENGAPIDPGVLLEPIAELREHRAKAPINGGTGAEFWLLGWELRKQFRYSGALPATIALAGCVLRGYVGCSLAIALSEPLDYDAALAAWAADASKP